MELFTFMRAMGGSTDRMDVLPLRSERVQRALGAHSDTRQGVGATAEVEDEDVEAMYLSSDERPPQDEGAAETEEHEALVDEALSRFASFDVENARCSKAEDLQHLLSVIESGFGDFNTFNSLVRGLFATGSTRQGGSASAAAGGTVALERISSGLRKRPAAASAVPPMVNYPRVAPR